jgi:hypothetical protein
MIELFFFFSFFYIKHIVAVLFGLFGGAWSTDGDYDGIVLVNVRRGRGFRGLDGFDLNGNFLVNVGRGRGFVVHDFFNDSDLGILVLFLTTLSLHSAEHDNGQDKEHPEQNSNSAA